MLTKNNASKDQNFKSIKFKYTKGNNPGGGKIIKYSNQLV